MSAIRSPLYTRLFLPVDAVKLQICQALMLSSLGNSRPTFGLVGGYHGAASGAVSCAAQYSTDSHDHVFSIFSHIVYESTYFRTLIFCSVQILDRRRKLLRE